MPSRRCRSPDSRYQPYVLFYTGLAIDVYYAVSPIPLFFLALDRCLILLATYGYGYKAKKVLFSVELLTIFSAVTITVVMSVVELPLDDATGYNHGLARTNG